MAEMIPDTISASTSATNSEKAVFQFLRDVFQPDEDYFVWYEPGLASKYPDFIIYGQHLGLLVMEVKGWHLDRIVRANPEKFVIKRNDRDCSEDNPLEQARKAYQELMDRIKGFPSLLHTDGPHKGQPKIPIGFCAALTNIDLHEAEKKNLLSVMDETKCLYKDDFQGNPNDRPIQRRFHERIAPCFRAKAQFKAKTLIYDELKTLRAALFPEIRLTAVSKTQELPLESVEALDLVQERVAKSISSGHRILKGVVGSGKTVVLAARAKFLARCNPQLRILVVCYNVSLAQPLRVMINADNGEHSNRIDVTHYHGLVKRILNKPCARDETKENFEEWEQRITNEFVKIAQGEQGVEYDAILVDEGQDFTLDMVRGIVGLLNVKSDSLLFCYDPSQNVFGRRTPIWKHTGMMVQGKKPITLKKSYRSTREIILMASRFADIKKEQDDNIETPLLPESTLRQGLLPYLKRFANQNALQAHVLNGILYYVKERDYAWSDIGLIYATHPEDFPLRFTSLFHSSLGYEGMDRLYWVNQTHNSKHSFDLSLPAVKMCTIESSKGLEFKVVFLIGVDSMPRKNREEESERQLIYVGLTRARDILHVPYIEETPYTTQLRNICEEIRQLSAANPAVTGK